MSRKVFTALLVAFLLSSFVMAAPVSANPPAPDDTPSTTQPPVDGIQPHVGKISRPIDQPNLKELQRLRERQRLLEMGLAEEAASLATQGTDRVLVILVEFGGTDVFTWNPGDTWDPLGIADPNEVVYDESGSAIIGDCSNIITQTQTFTYTSPLHNEIPRPLSADDRSGDTIWTEDFSPDWFDAFMFGDGVVFDYTRQDDSVVYEDFTGQSVRQYYLDMSGGQYDIEGDVIGWITLPHSTWYYGADTCPGARSLGSSSPADTRIPGGGTPRDLVKDAVDAVNAISDTIEGFDWTNYDQDGDGLVDRLWIVHAGYGEEDATDLLNRTSYGESAIWSHSSSVTPAYPVSDDVAVGPYIIMPENGGIGVFAHEYGHNLGADDLYSYSGGESSPGFWTLMADDWTGYPIGFEPPAVDPWHLDLWGWLDPIIIDDPTQEYIFELGQASEFPGGEGVYRGAKIELPDGQIPLPVQPVGDYQWWGGKLNLANGMMTTVSPISIPAEGATLSFDLAYDIEMEWDFLWVQASADGGATWETLTNDETICTHDPDWIGGEYGFPDDLCAAGIGGFSGWNAAFPDYEPQEMDLTDFAEQDILLRFWYMTDWATTYFGPYVDNIEVLSGDNVLFSDDAESEDGNWDYIAPWERNDGLQLFTHNYYLQWRNVGEDGGYDSALGDSRWRFGPANTGLLVWYNNNYYTDNEIPNYLFDGPSFGPKGRALVVDSHPEPYRDPALVTMGYNNEGGNVTSRMQMRDAPFSLEDTVDFVVKPPYTIAETAFEGRGAVGSFHDAMGYYPGAEYVNRGPAYPPDQFKWVTKQWDASAIVPALDDYPFNAPGYGANDEIRFWCEPYVDGPYAGYLGCYWLGAGVGLGYDGGTGNPGDYLAQYGWHIEILEQSSTNATIRVWNALQEADMELTADPETVMTGDQVDFTFTMIENQGGALDLFACAPIDNAVSSYVPESATNGAIPMPISCPEVAEAIAGGAELGDLVSSAAGPVEAVAFATSVPVGGGTSFGFSLTADELRGVLTQSVDLYDAGLYWTRVSTMVDVESAITVELPLILQ